MSGVKVVSPKRRKKTILSHPRGSCHKTIDKANAIEAEFEM